MTPSEERFAVRAVRRRTLFLALSIAGLAVALALTVIYAVLRWRDPSFPLGARAVIVLLVLLNARQNLRQWRYSRVLDELLRARSPAP